MSEPITLTVGEIAILTTVAPRYEKSGTGFDPISECDTKAYKFGKYARIFNDETALRRAVGRLEENGVFERRDDGLYTVTQFGMSCWKLLRRRKDG